MTVMTAALAIGAVPLKEIVTWASGTLAVGAGILPFGLLHAVAEHDGRRQDDRGAQQTEEGGGDRPPGEAGHGRHDEGGHRNADEDIADPLAGLGQPPQLGPPDEDWIVAVAVGHRVDVAGQPAPRVPMRRFMAWSTARAIASCSPAARTTAAPAMTSS